MLETVFSSPQRRLAAAAAACAAVLLCILGVPLLEPPSEGALLSTVSIDGEQYLLLADISGRLVVSVDNSSYVADLESKLVDVAGRCLAVSADLARLMPCSPGADLDGSGIVGPEDRDILAAAIHAVPAARKLKLPADVLTSLAWERLLMPSERASDIDGDGRADQADAAQLDRLLSLAAAKRFRSAEPGSKPLSLDELHAMMQLS